VKLYNLEKSVGWREESPRQLPKKVEALGEWIAKKGKPTPEDVETTFSKGRP